MQTPEENTRHCHVLTGCFNLLRLDTNFFAGALLVSFWCPWIELLRTEQEHMSPTLPKIQNSAWHTVGPWCTFCWACACKHRLRSSSTEIPFLGDIFSCSKRKKALLQGPHGSSLLAAGEFSPDTAAEAGIPPSPARPASENCVSFWLNHLSVSLPAIWSGKSWRRFVSCSTQCPFCRGTLAQTACIQLAHSYHKWLGRMK